MLPIHSVFGPRIDEFAKLRSPLKMFRSSCGLPRSPNSMPRLIPLALELFPTMVGARAEALHKGVEVLSQSQPHPRRRAKLSGLMRTLDSGTCSRTWPHRWALSLQAWERQR
jgi:hypothetical protein